MTDSLLIRLESTNCNSALGAGERPRAATTTGDDEQSQ